MGYKSKACIRTTLKGVGAVRGAWEAATGGKLEDEAGMYSQGDVATITFDDVSWHAEPGARALVGLMESDGFWGEPWSFVRIGEEAWDFEQRRSPNAADGDGKVLLCASLYIEGADMLPVLPDFSLREFAMLVMMMYTRMEESDPKFAKAVLGSSKLLADMVAERDRQEAGDE